MNKHKFRNIVAFSLFAFTGMVQAGSPFAFTQAGDWKNSWASEKGGSAQRCAKTFKKPFQAVCMDNEKKGYDRMQGDFGLPSSVAAKAKARCARTFDSFKVQAVCMDSEKKVYDKTQNQ